MARRTATVTQADIARAIRAVQAAGLPVRRVVVRPEGVAVETTGAPHISEPHDFHGQAVKEDRVPIL